LAEFGRSVVGLTTSDRRDPVGTFYVQSARSGSNGGKALISRRGVGPLIAAPADLDQAHAKDHLHLFVELNVAGRSDRAGLLKASDEMAVEERDKLPPVFSSYPVDQSLQLISSIYDRYVVVSSQLTKQVSGLPGYRDLVAEFREVERVVGQLDGNLFRGSGEHKRRCMQG